MTAKIVYLSQRSNTSKPRYIDSAELCDMFCRNFSSPDRDSMIAAFVNGSDRALSEVAIWFLEHRGFSADDIPKMATASSGASQEKACA